jgi:rhodanese-related sulfurtransferase
MSTVNPSSASTLSDQVPSAHPSGKTRSPVTEVAPATSTDALSHFSSKLQYETDCADVYAALSSGAPDFVLLDVRGRKAFGEGHVRGALNIPLTTISAERMSAYPVDTIFVVYCAGPHCNGANKAAIRLAKLGRPVKEMIGGITGWLDEGFTLEES